MQKPGITKKLERVTLTILMRDENATGVRILYLE